MKKTTLLCVGAGGRGTMYCSYALDQPNRLQVVGVAEPREFYRERLARTHQLPFEFVFAAEQARLENRVVELRG